MEQTALITGAAKNIGKGIARTLLEAGYKCILVDLDETLLRKTVIELGGKEKGCYEYVADISSYEQIDTMLAWIQGQGLTLTALVNNAAYESQVTVAGIKPAELSKSFRTNLEGPFYMASAVLKDWVKCGLKGNVMFTSSVHGHLIRTHPLYSASKAAIEMFVKEAALEFAEYGIRINAVAPGPTQDTPELKPDFRVPSGYYQQPVDIGETVAFLISEKARFITGQTLVVDGGYGIAHTHHWLKKGNLHK